MGGSRTQLPPEAPANRFWGLVWRAPGRSWSGLGAVWSILGAVLSQPGPFEPYWRSSWAV
eukprot:689211-Pyramimonas_sp.AAC.1